MVWTKAFSSQAVLLELTSKLRESLGGEMDIPLPLNFLAVAKHCCRLSYGCLFLFFPACFWKYCVSK